MNNGISNQHIKVDADYVDLRTIFKSLLDKKWIIIFVSLLLFIIAITYCLLKPTKYQASILLKIQHKQHNILGTITNPNQQLGLANSSEEPLAVQIALIQSEFILRPVIKNLGLDINVTPYRTTFFDSIFTNTNIPLAVSTLELPSTYLNSALKLTIEKNKHYRLYDKSGSLLIEGKEGQLVKNTDALKVKIDSINAPDHSEFSVTKDQEFELLNKIRSNLSISDLSGSVENTASKVAILRVSLTGYDPLQITQILNQIAIITQLKNIQLKTQEEQKTLSFLQQQLPIIQLSLKQAEAKLNEYRAANGKVDSKFQTEYLLKHLADINRQIEDVRLKKVNLMEKYTSNHPAVIATNQEFSTLEKTRKQLFEQLKQLPGSEQEALNLKREVDVKNNLYMLILNQIHQLDVIKTGIMSDVEILSYASTPYKLQQIKLPIIGFFSLFVGFILGCIGVLAWRILIQRIDDPNWTEHTWNIKNLAIIPYSKQQALCSHSNTTQKLKSLPLLAYQTPNDSAIESLCNLRSFLQLTLESSPNNIVAMMGIAKGVGKTFITANLAALLARIGHTVLVIDGDIRDGHMNDYFKTNNTAGLSDVISEAIKIEDAIIHSQNFENLSYLPAGTKSEQAADLLTCDLFKSLLLALSKNYHYVLINTPANLLNTDNFLIGSLAGINLLVLGAHMHEAAEIDSVIKNFNHADIKLNGCIFNNLKPSKSKKQASTTRLINDKSNITTIRYNNSGIV